jgi:methionine synthase II (cobalamin-independent)
VAAAGIAMDEMLASELGQITGGGVFALAAAGKATRTVHFCLGDIARKPSTEVQNLHSLLPLLQALQGHVDRVLLECSYAGQWQELELLADVPEDMEVVAGVADVNSDPSSPQELSQRMGALLDVVSEERLLVSTSCGCGRVPHDDAIRLVDNLVKAARCG